MRGLLIPLIIALLAATTACESATPAPVREATNPPPTAAEAAGTEAATVEPTASEAAATAAPETDSTAAPVGDGIPGTISVSRAPLREAPSFASQQVAELQQNDQITILGRTERTDYLLVATEDGTRGWIAVAVVSIDGFLDQLPIVTP